MKKICIVLMVILISGCSHNIRKDVPLNSCAVAVIEVREESKPSFIKKVRTKRHDSATDSIFSNYIR